MDGDRPGLGESELKLVHMYCWSCDELANPIQWSEEGWIQYQCSVCGENIDPDYLGMLIKGDSQGVELTFTQSELMAALLSIQLDWGDSPTPPPH